MSFFKGCPSLVINVPQCTKSCQSNYEKCYSGTGFCSKCKLGFDGVDCEYHLILLLYEIYIYFIYYPFKQVMNGIPTAIVKHL